jgi:hypothetical protein
MAKRKKVTILVTVSVPEDMTAAHARQEVRSLINHQANWSANYDDVKAVSVRPAKKEA